MKIEEFLTFAAGIAIIACVVVPWGVGAITILLWVFE